MPHTHTMTKAESLACRECGRRYGMTFRYACGECLGPLDVAYDISTVSRDVISARERTYWRYAELLPVMHRSNMVGMGAGMTPLLRAERLGERLGLRNLYVKNESVNPTYSFEDRPAGVAVSKARELGIDTVGCVSTGNLAAATAAHAAKAGMPCYAFVPKGLEGAKIVQAAAYGARVMEVDGTYDDASRAAAQAGDGRGIGMVNVNLRPYYAEGSKTLAFEVAEQLGWRAPDHLVMPVGSGAMLNAVCKGFEELEAASLVDDCAMHPHAAQPRGCSPVADAFRGNGGVVPVERPDTVAKSLAIGDPGDGRYALKRLEQYGGSAAWCTDREMLDATMLLAKTEGVFAEPAGGVAVAVLKKMAEDGTIPRDESVVCYVTGNGLKAADTLKPVLAPLMRHGGQTVRDGDGRAGPPCGQRFG